MKRPGDERGTLQCTLDWWQRCLLAVDPELDEDFSHVKIKVCVYCYF